MKRKDLKPGMEVAIKTWGNNFNKGIVLDTRCWEEPQTWARPEFEEVVTESGATVKTSAKVVAGARKVLVKIITDRNFGTSTHVTSVPLQNILGLYDEMKAVKDAQDERARLEREARNARQRREEELRDHARQRLAVFKHAHPSPATEMDPFDVTVAIKTSTLEHLLSIAEKAVEK